MFTILITNHKTKTKECFSIFSTKKDAKIQMQALASDIISELSNSESNIFNLINDSNLKIYTKHQHIGWLSNTFVDVCLYSLELIAFNKTNCMNLNSNAETQTNSNLSESNQFTQTENTVLHKNNNQSQSLVFLDELRAKLDNI